MSLSTVRRCTVLSRVIGSSIARSFFTPSYSIRSHIASFRPQTSITIRSFSTEQDSHDDFKPKIKTSPPTPKDAVEEAKETIKKDVQSHAVFLYMKGTPDEPRCGFSANVAKILKHMGVQFGSRDVLADNVLRDAIKSYSDWPTLPQLYVNGEFVGGSDIVTQMFRSGELQKLVESAKKN